MRLQKEVDGHSRLERQMSGEVMLVQETATASVSAMIAERSDVNDILIWVMF